MFDWYFAAGDLGFFWEEQIRAFSWLPQVFWKDIGFGSNTLLSLWLDYPFRLVLKAFSFFGFSWWFIEKILWMSVFALAIYSSHKLASYVLGKNPYTRIATLIYSANTYLFILFDGGQLGVAWAYSFFPFVLFQFMNYAKGNRKNQIAVGMCLALLIVFDLRFAYLLVAIVMVGGFFSLLPLIVAGMLHMYWILPTLLASGGPADLGSQYTNSGMLTFLSFADFSHTISLLHPNWPENLFGKVYFQKPEFLIISIIAFASLLYRERKIKFFAVLALVGAFFAKGVNDPFGYIFTWMFEHVPGFIMFRDPTKFYVYIAVAYSILIPFVFTRIHNSRLRVGAAAIFVCFWLFTLRSVFVGEARGNFGPQKLPTEYVQLKNLLISDEKPSRTLWIPQRENFSFQSPTHPILTSEISFLSDVEFESKITDMGVRYVIVPTDIYKRMFLTDYQFDPTLRQSAIDALRKTSLTERTDFAQIGVFENSEFVMSQDVPDRARKQERLATIGLGSSVVLFMIFLWILLF